MFAGAGTSVELGVPAMAGLATEFLQHAKQWSVESDLVARIMGDTLDIELLIERLDKLCSARDPLTTVIGSVAGLAAVDVIRAEVEWFVQHACERIVPRAAYLMWGSVLKCADAHDIAFVTTNYDRAIELAANVEGLTLDDGFELLSVNERASWNGFVAGTDSPKLIKLHGSTDWFAGQASGEPSKLRHPMPLFGRGTLRLPQGGELGSAMVLPSREKLLTRPPYPRLTQAFLNACDACEMALFVGTSLRDPHVRDAATTIATNRPVFVVTPHGESLGVPRAKPLKAWASDFLVSTLPAALSSSNPVSVLGSCSEHHPERQGVLEFLKIALDAHQSRERRCEALETLDQQATSISAHTINELLEDEDGTVARYALGLVSTSHDVGRLLEAAHRCRHAADASFKEELHLLEQIASTRGSDAVA